LPRDGQGAGLARALRHRPGHQQEARPEAGRAVRQDRGASGPDVVVVGGGPAGSTAAALLVRQGLAVTLLERERFPRDHIGESLLPASMPILDVLGVLPRLEAQGYLKKWGATMVWGTTPEPWSWHFRETNTQFPHAYQVWRAAFGHMRLQKAARPGDASRVRCRGA